MELIDKVVKVTQVAFFCAATVLCLYTVSLLHEVRAAAPVAVTSVSASLNAHLASLDGSVAAITNTLTNKKTGLLVVAVPKAVAAVASAGLTTAQVVAEERDAFVPQSKALQASAENASTLLINANGAITDLRASEKTLNALVAAVSPDLVAHITKNVDDATTALSDTAVHTDVVSANIEILTGRFDKMAADGERITGDGAEYFHNLTHPTKWQRILSGLESGGSLAAWAALHKP